MDENKSTNKKKTKGQYGYRDYHRRVELSKVLFGLVCILLQLGARNFTDNQSLKNILTVMAVLSVLPTANIASPMLAAWRYKSASNEFYHRISAYEPKFELLYDLILTTKEAVMPMDAIVIHPKGVFAYCVSNNKELEKAESSLNAIFTTHKLDANFKIIKEETSFFHRLDSLKPSEEYPDDGSISHAIALLKSLSM